MIRWLLASVRPVYRETAIFYYRWALRDLQRKNPFHPDIHLIVTRLRDLRRERYTGAPSLLRRVIRWL